MYNLPKQLSPYSQYNELSNTQNLSVPELCPKNKLKQKDYKETFIL